jgi:arylsulfatase A-like enzyme
VLFLDDPAGMSRDTRRTLIESVNAINQMTYQELADPETQSRISQYEMAFRMQTSVPELTDMRDEPAGTWDLYGPLAREPGTFAYNCLLARRMAERGVRFTQIYQRGWDLHVNAVGGTPEMAAAVDRGCYALITDLKQRGLLDDTLVVWGGEFGRTVYSQGGLTRENFGRDHHVRCFTSWMAGGGVKPGISYGETDDFSYNVVRDSVPVRDFNATILHLFGIDHNRLTFKFQGLEQKLTGTTPAKVVEGLLA